MKIAQSFLVRDILAEAVKRRASDVHFTVGNRPTLRLNGQLVFLEDQAIIDQEFMTAAVAELLTAEQQKQLASEREIIVVYDFERDLRFKINIFYQRGFLSMTLRYLPAMVPTLDSLKLNPLLKELVKLPKGLVIVSGGFGSGRSTTVAAMVEEINRSRQTYIITVEDAIEYVFTNNLSIIEQREVGRDSKSFADALKYFEEEDGDVLFLEKMEDPQLMPTVLEIARASALVLTTVTAGSAAETVSRILNSFQSFDQERIRDLLASALRAVICQKTLPLIGGGVAVIQEVLTANDIARSMIKNGDAAQLESLIRNSAEDQMISFDQILAKLVLNHRVSLVDALDNASNRKSLEKMIR